MIILRFPKNEKQKRKWLSNMRRENCSPSTVSVICSEHFRSTCFDKSKKLMRLKRDAEPTRFNSEEEIVSGDNIPFSQEVLIGKQSDICQDIQPT